MGKTVAITGVNSYFASTVLPLLDKDPEVDRIVGIDVTPKKWDLAKLEHHQKDVRSPEIEGLLAGVDTVYHLAFVVAEIHDKKETYDININGSKNVFNACVKNKVRKVVYTSSATAYGAHADNPLSITEERPLRGNTDSYYSSSKAEVERFAQGFFASHPDIVFTVLRVGLLVGPNMNNMFHKFWSRRASIFIWGVNPFLQLIHEKDLGTALLAAFKKDLPGVYNVAAPDGIPTHWVFDKAGVKLISLPGRVLKAGANLAFKLHLEDVSQGWLSLSEHTIHINSDKFKKAAGWEPEYTSQRAFLEYLETRPKRKGLFG